MAPENRRITAVVGAIVAAGILAASFIWTPETLHGYYVCTFREWTGIPCPGCGMTRGICAISNGSFREAWRLNPFSYMVYAAMLAAILLPLGLSFIPEKSRCFWKFLWHAALVSALGLLIFGIARAFCTLMS